LKIRHASPLAEKGRYLGWRLHELIDDILDFSRIETRRI
jgi:signal transduction histidine kinase